MLSQGKTRPEIGTNCNKTVTHGICVGQLPVSYLQHSAQQLKIRRDFANRAAWAAVRKVSTTLR